ncbi:MAG: fatty acid CoA ligase family protein, partial [Pirellulales bacterium]
MSVANPQSAIPNPQSAIVNVAARMTEYARESPHQIAVAETAGRDATGKYRYRQVTYGQLEEDSNRLASGLQQLGVEPGTRMVLLVRPGIDFISLVFALFKVGAVVVLVDPGMGRKNLVRCLADTRPEGFIAVPQVHAVRTLLRRRFPKSRIHVTAGRRWFWGGVTLEQLRGTGSPQPLELVRGGSDPAAIIFTTGSTGVPKGVLYCHSNFDQQVAQIQQRYGIEPGTVDLAAFPLFGLFNNGMGATTIVPDMDATRPASVDPQDFLTVAHDWNATQSFASPALWHRVSLYCERNNVRMPTFRRLLSAGAPVPGRVLARLKAALVDDAQIHTPYGATEALPVASISATEVLNETQQATDEGAGVCVGSRFPEIEWRVIEMVDGPIASLHDARLVEAGQIGELLVTGPVVTRQYVTRVEANRLGKIADGERVWHRMGDVGYLDDDDRFWFCGRMTHRVRTADGTLFTIPCEAVFNTHSSVYRSALVGIGTADRQRPVLVVEPTPEYSEGGGNERELIAQLLEIGARHPHTAAIKDILVRKSLPVDIRHNAKIFREKLAPWAAKR